MSGEKLKTTRISKITMVNGINEEIKEDAILLGSTLTRKVILAYLLYKKLPEEIYQLAKFTNSSIFLSRHAFKCVRTHLERNKGGDAHEGRMLLLNDLDDEISRSKEIYWTDEVHLNKMNLKTIARTGHALLGVLHACLVRHHDIKVYLVDESEDTKI